MLQNTALIGVDWGTTHVRAYRLSIEGTLLAQKKSSDGMSRLQPDEFEIALQKILLGWSDSNCIPILMTGMVGAQQGWKEAPYLPCPTNLNELHRHLITPPQQLLTQPLFIVPGICLQDKARGYDVMRGEETAILGALQKKASLFCLPGTHSKWVTVKEGIVTNFKTYLTGELFALLTQHSLLKKQLQVSEHFNQEAFLLGLEQAYHSSGLLADLFNLRARNLLNPSPLTESTDYLSGLLIGHEMMTSRSYWETASSVTLIADQKIAARYELALTQQALRVILVESEKAVTRGLWEIARVGKIV